VSLARRRRDKRSLESTKTTREEIVMNAQEPRRHPRLNAARMTLLWIAVIVLAVAPWPWW
jgi:hypothetical protein